MTQVVYIYADTCLFTKKRNKLALICTMIKITIAKFDSSMVSIKLWVKTSLCITFSFKWCWFQQHLTHFLVSPLILQALYFKERPSQTKTIDWFEDICNKKSFSSSNGLILKKGHQMSLIKKIIKTTISFFRKIEHFIDFLRKIGQSKILLFLCYFVLFSFFYSLFFIIVISLF